MSTAVFFAFAGTRGSVNIIWARMPPTQSECKTSLNIADEPPAARLGIFQHCYRWGMMADVLLRKQIRQRSAPSPSERERAEQALLHTWPQLQPCSTDPDGNVRLLRYLYLRGLIAVDLTSCVPKAAHWSLAKLPAFLSPAQVACVLGLCERRSG
jgi:hypothetical protein